MEGKTRGSVPSEGGVLRAEKLGGDGLAVRHGGFSIKIRWKDVCVKLFNVAVQLIAVNKDLRGIKTAQLEVRESTGSRG